MPFYVSAKFYYFAATVHETCLLGADHKLHVALAVCEDRHGHLHLFLLLIGTKQVPCQGIEG